jgi:succinate-semialdehyde dehydrogenase/glutarate-semialdehyde dehydrogenase
LTEGVTVGPLIHDEAVARVDKLVENAASAAPSSIQAAPLADELGGSFYAPTLIEGGTDFELELACFEIFGPVCAVYRVEDEDEMIELANQRPTALRLISTHAMWAGCTGSPKRLISA